MKPEQPRGVGVAKLTSRPHMSPTERRDNMWYLGAAGHPDHMAAKGGMAPGAIRECNTGLAPGAIRQCFIKRKAEAVVVFLGH